eukprot:464897-Pelagomonas_calceolata.AAC.10
MPFCDVRPKTPKLPMLPSKCTQMLQVPLITVSTPRVFAMSAIPWLTDMPYIETLPELTIRKPHFASAAGQSSTFQLDPSPYTPRANITNMIT